jgi:hypothetical protein
MIASCDAIRDDVSVYARDTTDHGALANATKLLHGGEPAKDDTLSDVNMPGQRRAIGECYVIFNPAVVADMAVRHEIPIISDARDAAARTASHIHGDGFANHAVRANRQPTFGEIVLSDLSSATQYRLGVHDRAVTDTRVSVHNNMGHQSNTVTQNYVSAHQTKRPYVDIVAKRGTFLHDRRGMNGHRHPASSGRIMALNSASAH